MLQLEKKKLLQQSKLSSQQNKQLVTKHKQQIQRLQKTNKELNQLKNKEFPWDQYYSLYRAKQKRDAETNDASIKTKVYTDNLKIIESLQKKTGKNFLNKKDREEISNYIRPMMETDAEQTLIKKENVQDFILNFYKYKTYYDSVKYLMRNDSSIDKLIATPQIILQSTKDNIPENLKQNVGGLKSIPSGADLINYINNNMDDLLERYLDIKNKQNLKEIMSTILTTNILEKSTTTNNAYTNLKTYELDLKYLKNAIHTILKKLANDQNDYPSPLEKQKKNKEYVKIINDTNKKGKIINLLQQLSKQDIPAVRKSFVGTNKTATDKIKGQILRDKYPFIKQNNIKFNESYLKSQEKADPVVKLFYLFTNKKTIFDEVFGADGAKVKDMLTMYFYNKYISDNGLINDIENKLYNIIVQKMKEKFDEETYALSDDDKIIYLKTKEYETSVKPKDRKKGYENLIRNGDKIVIEEKTDTTKQKIFIFDRFQQMVRTGNVKNVQTDQQKKQLYKINFKLRTMKDIQKLKSMKQSKQNDQLISKYTAKLKQIDVIQTIEQLKEFERKENIRFFMEILTKYFNIDNFIKSDIDAFNFMRIIRDIKNNDTLQEKKDKINKFIKQNLNDIDSFTQNIYQKDKDNIYELLRNKLVSINSNLITLPKKRDRYEDSALDLYTKSVLYKKSEEDFSKELKIERYSKSVFEFQANTIFFILKKSLDTYADKIITTISKKKNWTIIKRKLINFTLTNKKIQTYKKKQHNNLLTNTPYLKQL